MNTVVKEQRIVSNNNTDVSQYEGESTEQSKRVRSGCTKDYSKFIIPTHQRKHDDGNMKSIIASIQKHGVISSIATRPSTENPNKLEVWDGQHTLSACRILGVPVNYDVWIGITNRAIIAINGDTGKGWGLLDYLKYGIDDNLEDYKFIDKVYRDNRKIAPTGLLTLFGGGYSNKSFKQLKWRALSKEHGFKVLLNAKDFARLFNTKHWFHARFLWGFSDVMKTGKYDHKRMLTQMEKCSGYLTKQGDPGEYAKNIEMVYNYNVNSKNKVQFVQ